MNARRGQPVGLVVSYSHKHAAWCKRLTQVTSESKQVVSDIVAVSDGFLRKLQSHPMLLYDLSSRRFEEVVAELLNKLKYEVTLTPAWKDGGKDIYAVKKDHLGTFLYSCTWWSANDTREIVPLVWN